MSVAKYLVIDTETSGVLPIKHGLIQVGAVTLDKDLNILDKFSIDICPPEGTEFTKESLELTGFTMDRIKKGVNYDEFTTQFLEFIESNFTQKPIIVGQFWPFDFMFLNIAFVTTNKEWVIQKWLQNDIIDTKALVNTLNLKAELSNSSVPFPVTSLSKPGGLVDKLELKRHTAHDALSDVMMTVDALKKLMEKF